MKKTIISILFLVFLSGSVAATDIEVQNELERGYPEDMVFIKGGCFEMGDQFGAKINPRNRLMGNEATYHHTR